MGLGVGAILVWTLWALYWGLERGMKVEKRAAGVGSLFLMWRYGHREFCETCICFSILARQFNVQRTRYNKGIAQCNVTFSFH